MSITSDQLHDPPPAVADRFAGRGARIPGQRCSARQAIALYVCGIFVETLGLALIAAYGLWGVGMVMFVAGVWMGTVGNRAWPDPESSMTAAPQLPGILMALRYRHHVGGESNHRQR